MAINIPRSGEGSARRHKPAAAARSAKPRIAAHNADIASRLERYASLLEIDGANAFRVRAYRNAARTLETLPQDVGEFLAAGGDFDDLPGIGRDLAGKIVEIATTGHFHDLDALSHRLPVTLLDLARVPALGPKRIKMLFDTFGIRTLADLGKAVRAQKLDTVRGFGPKIQQSIREATEHATRASERLLLAAAEPVAAALVAWLKDAEGVRHVAVAGSFRRRRETVGDLDILVTTDAAKAAIARFTASPEVAKIMSRGTTRATVILHSGLQVDLRVVPEESYGAALVYFTGSKAHNIALRKRAVDRGLKINEYGVFRGRSRVAGETEKDVYASVALAYVEPELRENRGEIEAAAAHRLPHLVRREDLRGDLHAHTDASDGDNTLEEMVEAARALGYSYLAITDHSHRLGIAHGLDAARLRKQMASIDRLNARLRGFRVLKAVEVDILADGRLDLDDAVLADLDLAVASVHSRFDLDAERQTERILRAMDNPHVSIIGHPTGRLIGEREPYALDIERLLRAAAERRCCLEINAQPERMDLTDTHCRLAKSLGVALAISSDAHSTASLGLIRFGIDQARRGWLEPADIVNTLPLHEMLARLRRR